jgi:hypothetical protein
MIFQIIPTAEASINTLMKSVSKVLLNPLIKFLFALATAYFIYGVIRYFFSPDNEEVRKSSKSSMLWGIIGMFIMVAVWGIMSLILDTLGESRITVDKTTGSYSVEQMQ